MIWFKESDKHSHNANTNDTWQRLDTILDKVHGLYLENKSTKFSHVSSITFSKIKIRDGGRFQCWARLSGNHSSSTEFRKAERRLIVLKPLMPSAAKRYNLNNTELTPTQGIPVTLDCSSHGRPQPVYRWTKDEQEFPTEDMENISSIIVSDDNSTIKFITLPTHNGIYECTASNRAGSLRGRMTLDVQEPIVLPPFLIALIVIGSLVVLVLVIIMLWRIRVYNEKYKILTAAELLLFENGDPSSINPELGVDDQADLLPYNKSYEFPRENLRMGKQLGSGAFGRVVKAEAIGINRWERSTQVAVKMVKPNADMMYLKALMSELKIMIHLGRHINIVNLLGACTKELAKKELFVIVEYCRFGNLQKYLLQHRHHYINQIDPFSGEINFSIGQDLVDGYGSDLAQIREVEETSAAYLRSRSQTLTAPTGQDGYLTPNSQNQQQQPQQPEGQQQPQQQQQNQRPGRNKSVRYVAHPGQQPGRQRTISIQSDYSNDRIVMTDMTLLPPEEDDENSTNNPDSPTRRAVQRSQSTTSHTSQNGPGWRANIRGDYDVTNVKPIGTKDILCWAYQVNAMLTILDHLDIDMFCFRSPEEWSTCRARR